MSRPPRRLPPGHGLIAPGAIASARLSPHQVPDQLADATPPIACHACSGTFSLGLGGSDDASFVTGEGTPMCFHSVPYCAAFEAIDTVLDAVAFAQACRKKAGMGAEP